MAGEADILAALGADDLGIFSKSAAINDPWRIIGPAVSGAKFDASTWSPKTTATTAFLQGFLGAAANQYAKQDEANQLRAVTSVLPQLYANPLEVSAPDGVDNAAFESLRQSALIKNLQREALKQKSLDELRNELYKEVFKNGLEVNSAFEKKRAETAGEDAAWRGLFDGMAPVATQPKAPSRQTPEAVGQNPDGSYIYTPGEEKAAQTSSIFAKPTGNPNNPYYKESARLNEKGMDQLDSLRKEFNDRPEVKNFSLVSTKAQAMAQALKDNASSVTDQELVRYALLMIEPTSVVRDGEQAAMAQTQSVPVAWKNQLSKALTGESELGPDVREGMRRLAIRAYGAHQQGYEKALTFYKGMAAGRGLDPEGISFLGSSAPAEQLFPSAAETLAASNSQLGSLLSAERAKRNKGR